MGFAMPQLLIKRGCWFVYLFWQPHQCAALRQTHRCEATESFIEFSLLIIAHRPHRPRFASFSSVSCCCDWVVLPALLPPRAEWAFQCRAESARCAGQWHLH